MRIDGTLTKGNNQFMIDHPVDPAHMFLHHSGIESDEMKNLYDGVVVLDSAGRAEVTLPAWFEALNEAFRYQLTPMQTASPDLHIDQVIDNNRFTIAGGAAGATVCWQVTVCATTPTRLLTRSSWKSPRPQRRPASSCTPRSTTNPWIGPWPRSSHRSRWKAKEYRMRDDAVKRLTRLQADYEQGQARLLQLEQQAAGLRETLLRISGAVQILEELLSSESRTENGQPQDSETLTVP